MKKSILCVLALLCLNFSSLSQSQNPLNIGDKIFEIEISNLLNHSEGRVSLADLDAKLIILEFISTHCGTCIKSVGHLEKLQQEIGPDLQIMLITQQDKEKIEGVIAQGGWRLPIAVEDTLISKLFPHQTVPHQVWLRNREVIAITNWVYASKENVTKAIAGHDVQTNRKYEEEIDLSKPFLIPANYIKPLYQSFITSRANNGSAGFRMHNNSFLLYNQSIFKLYSHAFDLPYFPYDAYVLVETTDSLKQLITGPVGGPTGEYKKDQAFFNWFRDYTFCYSSIVNSKETVTEEFFKKHMQDDLNAFFSKHMGITGKMEKRKVKTLALWKTGDFIPQYDGNSKTKVISNDSLFSQANKSLDNFIIHLSRNHKEIGIPIVNTTGYTGNIDLVIKGGLSNIDEVNNELKPYGLYLEEAILPVEMLVIREISEAPSNSN